MTRDFLGYGRNRPDPQWPGGARVALSLVLNIEEGAELSLSMGDEANESIYEIIDPVAGVPNLDMESHFEYGTRVAFWRILDLLDRYQARVTFNTCGRAAEISPWLAQEGIARGHEVSCHGYRWEVQTYMTEAEEQAMIARAAQAIRDACGVRPVGWHSRAPSSSTRRLIVDAGFLYDSDAYNDDLPYLVDVGRRPHVVLPYSYDTNDMRFTRTETFRLADDFATYLTDAFDWLWQEGERTPRMMTVGLHLRIIGRPGRIAALQRFLDHATAKGGVWMARRDEIARHWRRRAGLETG
jgi:peptidoglycan/xylan/chitin deacetylase (PgdA/CDA1 family)